MDSSASNFSSFDPLTSFSSFPTFIIYPFDQLNSPQQSFDSVSADPLFSSLNYESFEGSDFNSSISSYGSSLLNFANSPPPADVLTLQNKSPMSSYLYEPHNLTSMPTGMSFQSILEAIQNNLTTDSGNGKINSVLSNSFNTTPIPSVYTILKLNENEAVTIPSYKNFTKSISTASTDNNFNDFNNKVELIDGSNQIQLHAYSKFTLLKRKPTKHHRKDGVALSSLNSNAFNVNKKPKDDINKSKAFKFKKSNSKNDKNTTIESSLIKNNSINECKVIKVKNIPSRPVVDIKDGQLVKIDGINRWKCDICEKSYTKKHNLVTHMFGHDGIKPFSCTTCGRCFKQLSHLNTHNLTHGAVKKYQCDICKHNFVQSSHLRRHMKLHNRKSFSCTVCRKEFTEFKDLHQHYAFDICTRVIATKSEMDKTNKFSCVDCNKSFSHLSHLRAHSNVHSNVRQFICTECGQEFNREHHLKYHILTHSGVKPFSCAICSRKFSQKSNLIRHKLTHSSEKRYKCNTCQQSFKHQQALNVHSMKHKPILPFKCQHCNKSFSRRHSFKAHINLHKDTKQHTCMCGAAFTLKCNLKRHQRDKNCQKILKMNSKSIFDIESNPDVLTADHSRDFNTMDDHNHSIEQIHKSTPKKKRKSMPRKTVNHEPEGDEDVTEAWKDKDEKNMQEKISKSETKSNVHFNFDVIIPDANKIISLVPETSKDTISTPSIENNSNLIVLTKLQPL